ncbi:MAG: CoA pyrophosphatase [Actinobacteria bacterium]|nr:CoA pyrophosphatase [Actinomycetota bacterium]
MSLWDPLATLPPVADDPGLLAAVLVPLYEDGDDLRMVLTKRPDSMRTHAGDVVFPGGMIDPGDDGPVGAATREAWEEVGIPPGDVEVLGGLSPLTTRSRQMWIAPVVARIRRPAELRPEPGEVDAIIEPTVGELLPDAVWTAEDWGGHTVWFHEFPDGILWGATARMVRQLLGYFRG